mmetsp:Transcript_744/g.1442  ORF Transcript_744/g.1442 Transcript_744/m.1442 type:complete len:88 (-) Transcript_744:293-556(-)
MNTIVTSNCACITGKRAAVRIREIWPLKIVEDQADLIVNTMDPTVNTIEIKTGAGTLEGRGDEIAKMIGGSQGRENIERIPNGEADQ